LSIMAQELVLIPKSKYDYLLSKSNKVKTNVNKKQNESGIFPQLSSKKEMVSVEQDGGLLVTSKRLFVKKSYDNIFSKLINEKKGTKQK